MTEQQEAQGTVTTDEAELWTEETERANTPDAPPPSVGGAEMPSDMWKRAGATDDEVRELFAKWADMAPDVQRAMAEKIRASSVNELAQMLYEQREAGEITGWTNIAPEAEPAQSKPEAPETPAETTEPREGEKEAREGEWAERAPITVDGKEHKAFDLSGGWLGAVVGDAGKAMKIVAADEPELEKLIRQAVEAYEKG